MASIEENKQQIVEVDWFDALKYAGWSEDNKFLVPTAMFTRGILVRENIEGIVVKYPYSFYKKSGERSKKETKKKAIFLFIPSGMIKKIKKVQKQSPKSIGD